MLSEALAGRPFAFPVERAVFLTVVHRLMVSGSDRSADTWRADQRLRGVEALQLHPLVRRGGRDGDVQGLGVGDVEW